MSAETRAKELYDQFSKLTDEDWATMTEEDFLQRLTQALHQAQNDKLEEAARFLMSRETEQSKGGPSNRDFCAGIAFAQQCIDLLKTPKD